MLSSPKLRAEVASTRGAGATIAACGACRARPEDWAFTSCAGATTLCENSGARWLLAGIASGAGATAATDNAGNLRFAAVEASGTAGSALRPRPGHDVGQWYIMIQLDVGGSHNGLGLIISLWRYRNDWLRRVLWFSLLRQSLAGPAGIERRKIFGGSVVDHVGPVEAGSDHNLRLLWPELN